MTTPLETFPEGSTLTAVALDLPFDVVVWDDPVTLMSVVTRILMKVFGYPKQKAYRLMMTVHEEGRAVVWTGELNKAEAYCVRLHASGLLASVEPSA